MTKEYHNVEADEPVVIGVGLDKSVALELDLVDDTDIEDIFNKGKAVDDTRRTTGNNNQSSKKTSP